MTKFEDVIIKIAFIIGIVTMIIATIIMGWLVGGGIFGWWPIPNG